MTKYEERKGCKVEEAIAAMRDDPNVIAVEPVCLFEYRITPIQMEVRSGSTWVKCYSFPSSVLDGWTIKTPVEYRLTAQEVFRLVRESVMPSLRSVANYERSDGTTFEEIGLVQFVHWLMEGLEKGLTFRYTGESR